MKKHTKYTNNFWEDETKLHCMHVLCVVVVKIKRRNTICNKIEQKRENCMRLNNTYKKIKKEETDTETK